MHVTAVNLCQLLEHEYALQTPVYLLRLNLSFQDIFLEAVKDNGENATYLFTNMRISICVDMQFYIQYSNSYIWRESRYLFSLFLQNPNKKQERGELISFPYK